MSDRPAVTSESFGWWYSSICSFDVVIASILSRKLFYDKPTIVQMTTLMIVIDDLHEECCVTLSFDLFLVAWRIENASNDLTMNSTYSKLFTFPFTVSKEKKEEIRVTSNLRNWERDDIMDCNDRYLLLSCHCHVDPEMLTYATRNDLAGQPRDNTVVSGSSKCTAQYMSGGNAPVDYWKWEISENG